MVAPISIRSIIRLPQRALPALRGVVDISSFAIGREKLGPAIKDLLRRQEIELNGVQLDTTAKIRLLGMLPPLEDRVNRDTKETIEAILPLLQLTAFLTPDQSLYILGDKQNAVISTDNAQSSPIELPEMIDISDRVRLMRTVVSVKLFKQAMTNYTVTNYSITGDWASPITGDWAAKLKSILASPNSAITYVSLPDGRKFARRLSELTGRKFRVQTSKEWGQVMAGFISSREWEWTETRESGLFIIRNYILGERLVKPDTREDIAFRLAEDIDPNRIPDFESSW